MNVGKSTENVGNYYNPTFHHELLMLDFPMALKCPGWCFVAVFQGIMQH